MPRLLVVNCPVAVSADGWICNVSPFVLGDGISSVGATKFQLLKFNLFDGIRDWAVSE